MLYKEHEIIQWAEARGIFDKATPVGQATKTLEEAVELLDAINKDDRVALMDAIGDVFVTIVLQARLNGLAIAECIDAAYEQIKDRKGRMEGGVFVKE